MSKTLSKGFDCTTCGTFHGFDAYVFAHWRSLLRHVCAVCGAKHEVVCGHATQKRKGKVPKAVKP